MSQMRILIAFALAHGALAGCERDSEDLAGARRESVEVADVVARVGDASIGVADVESLMAAETLSAEDAVRTLVDEAVLAIEAERLGLRSTPAMERAVERQMVRSLLHDLEQEATPESVSEEEIEEDYRRYVERYRVPEVRRSWHLLVKDSGPDGKALATSLLRELQRAGDPRAVFERYQGRETQDGQIEITAEDLPAVPKKTGLEKPYIDAVFGAKSEGPLKTVVETSYGWHAIFVAEIKPAEVKSRADVEEETRDRISQAKRLTNIVRIVQALNAEDLVSYDEAGVERLLAAEGLPERAN